MEFDKNGLPLPGRELDAWIAEHVMGWPRWSPTEHDACQSDDEIEALYPRWQDMGPRLGIWVMVVADRPEDTRRPFHPSTTFAFFQVMEAMRVQGNTIRVWKTYETPAGLGVWLRRQVVERMDDVFYVDDGYCEVLWKDWTDSEQAFAYAVCCCAWKAMGGENAQQS